MKELTKAEEEIMQVLWELDSAFVKDIITQMPEPKPAYNTVSTIVRILQQKGFVGYEVHGNAHKYYPLISKEAYTKSFMKGFVGRYFSGSYRQMVSFFTKQDKLSLHELEQLLQELKEKKS
ncbi:BlaI/MecI/CopY family transcriptional regulator [Rhodocytophaga aerolata]|uniref:BlaI/MecI/CopY family transcriptional regulator n=1 Tax=Rhodocytophaga aerolata TaxID=455078 RepID=A0ABT8RHP1_9BACT|nr:BlaI/MecI/CopY family transcriptional regulator [Rhodocytophaga aerolata]MDO1451621.1 BlaI/MecI/CopY family transcriptional regulator [Rhodocytophaga aerolata]